MYLDPQDFSTQVVGISRTPAPVVLFQSGPVIQGSEPMHIDRRLFTAVHPGLVKRRAVVAGGKIEVSLRVKCNGSTGMAADITCDLNVQNRMFVCHVPFVIVKVEAGKPVYRSTLGR